MAVFGYRTAHRTVIARPIARLSHGYRTVIETLSHGYRNLIATLSKPYRSFIVLLCFLSHPRLAVQLQRAARGFLGRGDALARIAELGGERADELTPIAPRVLGVKERSFRRKLKKPTDQSGAGDTRGGGAKKKADGERPARRTKAGSTKAAAPGKSPSSAGQVTGEKGRDRTEKLLRGGLRPMHGELALD